MSSIRKNDFLYNSCSCTKGSKREGGRDKTRPRFGHRSTALDVIELLIWKYDLGDQESKAGGIEQRSCVKIGKGISLI